MLNPAKWTREFTIAMVTGLSLSAVLRFATFHGWLPGPRTDAFTWGIIALFCVGALIYLYLWLAFSKK
jgi:hypothetical protein